MQCRSKRAGMSGILYCLPALICPSLVEKMMWIIQSILSVRADYFEIHHTHVAHGQDRIFATLMTIRMIFIAMIKLSPWVVLVLAWIPLSCFLMAERAKDKRVIKSWKFWHLMWHVTGAAISFIVTSLIHNGSPFL